jgi:RimJ/RimL family protein N-acetyltransferase
MPVTIRTIRDDDTAAYLELLKRLDAETNFMMFEPGERQMSVEEMRQRVKGLLAADNSMIFLAENESSELVGVLGAQGGVFRRNRHNVHIFIGILQAYTGQGIGRRLFETMETWARSWGAHRLELTVMVHNTRGVALYKRMGFIIEGTRRDSMKVDGQYVDEYEMSKILEDDEQ